MRQRKRKRERDETVTKREAKLRKDFGKHFSPSINYLLSRDRYSLLRSSLQAPGVGWMMYNFMVSSAKNIREQYTSHVYADPKNVTPPLLESRLALTKREGARFAPAAFLTGLLDPVSTREEFVSLFESVGETVPLLVLGAANAPKRSKAEMEALNGAKSISRYVEIKGALLPQEEYPDLVSEELYDFLVSASRD
jgi:hypothetical protein